MQAEDEKEIGEQNENISVQLRLSNSHILNFVLHTIFLAIQNEFGFINCE